MCSSRKYPYSNRNVSLSLIRISRGVGRSWKKHFCGGYGYFLELHNGCISVSAAAVLFFITCCHSRKTVSIPPPRRYGYPPLKKWLLIPSLYLSEFPMTIHVGMDTFLDLHNIVALVHNFILINWKRHLGGFELGLTEMCFPWGLILLSQLAFFHLL